MDPRIVHLSSVPPSEVSPGVTRRTLIWGDSLMVLHNTFEAGTTMATHAHPNEQITYLVEGEMLVAIGDTEYTLKPGDSLLIPSNVPHGVTVPKVTTVVLDAFSPPRDDFKW